MHTAGDARERKLLQEAQCGDRRARERLVEECGRLVRTTASRYRGLGLPFEDVVQEGTIGLLHAIDSYDPARGASFETFARRHIRHAVTDALTSQARLVRLPKQVVERRRSVTRAASQLTARSGRLPTPAEIAAETGVPIESVEAIRALPMTTASLDDRLAGDGATIMELFEDPAASDPEAEALALHRSEVVAAALERLPDRERQVIESRFGFSGPALSLVEMSHRLRLCPQRTRSIEQTALLRLAKMLEHDPTFQPPAWSEWTLQISGHPSRVGRRPGPEAQRRRAPSGPSRPHAGTGSTSSRRRRRAPAPRASGRR